MKKTFMVLLVALAVLALILLKKGSDEKSMRSASLVMDSTRIGQVKSMKIAKQGEAAALQVKDGKWLVARDGFPVDTAKVNKVLRDLYSLQDKEVVSHNPARYSEYGLDSAEAKRVGLLDGSGQSIADVIIGKTSGSDYSSTYWRWASKPDVYRTPGNFAWEIATKDDDWKDKKLTQAKSKDIKSIEATWKDSTGAPYHYKLEASSDSTWKMVEPMDSNRVKKALVEEMANRYADMSIDEFVAANDSNLSKVKVDSPAVWIKVSLKNGMSQDYRASKAMGGYAYTQHPSRNELIKLSSWRFDAFKKKPFELLDAPPANDSVKTDLKQAKKPQH